MSSGRQAPGGEPVRRPLGRPLVRTGDSGAVSNSPSAVLPVAQIKKAFFALVANGVRAAPLWDSKKQSFVGEEGPGRGKGGPCGVILGLSSEAGPWLGGNRLSGRTPSVGQL